MLDVSIGSVFGCAVPVVDGGSAARGFDESTFEAE